MKAIITVVGPDRVGIIAEVCTLLAEMKNSVVEISQTIIDGDLSLAAAHDVGAGIVAWSPLGSGFLTGQVREVGAGDFRAHLPRFHAENLAANHDRHAPIRGIAARLGLTPENVFDPCTNLRAGAAVLADNYSRARDAGHVGGGQHQRVLLAARRGHHHDDFATPATWAGMAFISTLLG